jgi:hypothetical protein
VIRIVQEQCDVVVAGNHDLYACRKIPEFNGGFEYPKNWYALSYAERKELAGDNVLLYEDNELSALLSPEEEAYLRSLPEYVVKEF